MDSTPEVMAMQAVLSYEAARANGETGSADYQRAVRLLGDLTPDRRSYWNVQITTIRQRYGS